MRPLLVLATLLALPLLAGHADAVDISACSNLNSAGTTYNLTASITNSNAMMCMNITANNVILDCQGYTIDGADTVSLNNIGVNVTGRTNITVRNCVVADWYFGIRLSDSNSSLLLNDISNSNANGVWWEYSKDSNMTNTTASDNENQGFSIIRTTNTTLHNNTARNNTYGIWFDDISNNNTVDGNRVDFNRLFGIFSSESSNNTIKNNYVSYNLDIGIQLETNSQNNTIFNNTAVFNNITAGIGLLDSPYNNISSNNASFNRGAFGRGSGIWIAGTTTNSTIGDNQIASNSVFGVHIESPSGNITIRSNTIRNNSRGVYMEGTSYNRISNNLFLRNNIGAELYGAHNNSINNNRFIRNSIAIKLTSSQNNTIFSNIFNNNGRNIVLDPSPNNSVINNTITLGGMDIADDSPNAYINNTINFADNSSFIKNNGLDTGQINSLFSFNFSVTLPNGTPANYTINSLRMYPDAPVAYTSSNGSLTGNFTPSYGGYNSLLFNATVGTNSIAITYPFLIGGNIVDSITYMLRDASPQNGQPSGYDSNRTILGRALLLSPPSADEAANSTTQILTIDENPLAINNVRVDQINATLLYRSNGSDAVNFGLQPIASYDNSTSVNITLPASSAFVVNSTSFNINISLDTPGKWNTIAAKLIGNNAAWKSNSTHRSTIKFRFNYDATSPKVFNLSDEFKLVSSYSNSTSYVALALEGNGSAIFTVQLPSSSTYSILYDGATCASPSCNSAQVSNNITIGVELGSIHTVEFYIPVAATTTTTSSGISSAATQGNVVQSSGIPTVEEQASTTSVPPSSVPARPGEYTISEEGAVILLEGNLTEDNKTLPGTVYLVGYPQSPFIVGGIVKSDPLKYGSLPQRAGFATKSLTSYDIEIKSGVAYFCMNYRGFENPQSVTVFEFTNNAWRELPRERFANNLTTSTACGTVKGTPYMVAGFISTGAVPVSTVVALPTALTTVPLAVYALGALAAVAYFAYRFRSGKK